MMMHIRDAKVRIMGVRMHAKRPALPMMAVVSGSRKIRNEVRLRCSRVEQKQRLWLETRG